MEVVEKETFSNSESACERCRTLNSQHHQKRNGFTKYFVKKINKKKYLIFKILDIKENLRDYKDWG